MPTVQPKVRVLDDGDRFKIRFAFREQMVAWARDELVQSRFVKGEAIPDIFGGVAETRPGFWTIPKTPAAAWTLLKTCPLRAIVPDELQKLAEQYVENVRFDGDHLQGVELEQPPIRVFDAWKHQLRGYHFSASKDDVAMLAMGMGTGKTKVAIDRAVNTFCQVVLIVCPPSVLGVWRREVKRHAPNAAALILDDDTKRVRPRLKNKTEIKVAAAQRAVEWRRRQNPKAPPLFIVVSYEAAREKGFREWMTREIWDLVILDESHRAKAPDGLFASAASQLRRVSRRRLCLTGTPMAHSPADLYSQFRFLDVRVFGDSFFRFKKRFVVEGFFGEALGFRLKDELQREFHSMSIVIDESVLDLPPFTMTERSFKLPPAVARLYREFWEEMVVAVESGRCTADNVLVKMLRAAQITSGFLALDDEGDRFDQLEKLHDLKADLFGEIMEDYQGDAPVVVFCRFRYDLDRVHAVAEKLGLSCGEVSGRRKDLTPNAELEDGYDLFAVQVQSGGVGVDFTKAYLGVLYSIDFSLGNFEQMLRRLVRPGQKLPVRFVKLIADGTIDRLVYQRLEARRSVVEEILAAVERHDLESIFDVPSQEEQFA